MSTIRVSNIQDTAGSNTSTPAAIANGIAKAWVNFNGTGTPAIRASYNVSSITDNGVGDYTVNFTTALADANYAAACSGIRIPTGSNGTVGAYSTAYATVPTTTYTSSLVRISCGGNTDVDMAIANVAIFR